MPSEEDATVLLKAMTDPQLKNYRLGWSRLETVV